MREKKTKLKSNLKYFALISNVYNNSFTQKNEGKKGERINSWNSIGGVGGGRTSTLIRIVCQNVCTKPVDYNKLRAMDAHTQRERERHTHSHLVIYYI